MNRSKTATPFAQRPLPQAQTASLEINSHRRLRVRTLNPAAHLALQQVWGKQSSVLPSS